MEQAQMLTDIPHLTRLDITACSGCSSVAPILPRLTRLHTWSLGSIAATRTWPPCSH